MSRTSSKKKALIREIMGASGDPSYARTMQALDAMQPAIDAEAARTGEELRVVAIRLVAAKLKGGAR